MSIRSGARSTELISGSCARGPAALTGAATGSRCGRASSASNARMSRSVTWKRPARRQFVDITEAAGLWSLEGRQLGVIFLDVDDDGDPDLFQGNDATPNALFRNEGDGSFVEVGDDLRQLVLGRLGRALAASLGSM